MSATAPDALGFVIGALESSGALCEADDDGRRATALLPEALAARLSLPEACSLALDADDRAAIPCGLGSPLLEKLIAEARAVVPVESRRLEVDPPRLSHVRSLAERFALSGSAIRTAALYALARAASRTGDSRVLTRADIEDAARVETARAASHRPAVGFGVATAAAPGLALVAQHRDAARKERP